jgi:hypothetical protein
LALIDDYDAPTYITSPILSAGLAMTRDEQLPPMSSRATESQVCESLTFSGLPCDEVDSRTHEAMSNPFTSVEERLIDMWTRPMMPLPDKLSHYDSASTDQGRRPELYRALAERLGGALSELSGNLPEVVKLADELGKLVGYGLTRRKLEQLPVVLNMEIVRAWAGEGASTRVLAAVAEDKIAEAIVTIPDPEGRALSILLAPSYRGRRVPPVEKRRERAAKVIKVGVLDDVVEQDLLELLARTLISLPLPNSHYL